MNFGVYLAPFHPVRENPGLAIERDIELICHLDRLAYDIVWIGEHHTGGMEIIAAPEVIAAAIVNRTRTIGLGLAVSSMAFQSPLLIADRVMLLDHLSRGRASLAFGPLGTATDIHAFGLDRDLVRARTRDAITATHALIRGETVSHETSWYRLQNASSQLRPFRDDIPVHLATQGSVEDASLAAELNLGLMTLAATTPAIQRDLPALWEVFARHADPLDPSEDLRQQWSLAAPVHIAETRSDALRNIRFGLDAWLSYMTHVTGMTFDGKTASAKAEAMVEAGFAIIGSPTDAIARLKQLASGTGGFGSFLQVAHNWADGDATFRSYELFARYVIPELTGQNAVRKSQWRQGQQSDDDAQDR